MNEGKPLEPQEEKRLKEIYERATDPKRLKW